MGPTTAQHALDICDIVNITEPAHINLSECEGPDDVLKHFYQEKTGAPRPELLDVKIYEWNLANVGKMDILVFFF
jgi:hypothetical protein